MKHALAELQANEDIAKFFNSLVGLLREKDNVGLLWRLSVLQRLAKRRLLVIQLILSGWFHEVYKESHNEG